MLEDSFLSVENLLISYVKAKKLDGLRISENQMENRVSITLNKDEVAWIVHILSDFYWNKGGETWGKTKKVDTIIFS